MFKAGKNGQPIFIRNRLVFKRDELYIIVNIARIIHNSSLLLHRTARQFGPFVLDTSLKYNRYSCDVSHREGPVCRA